MLVLWQLDTGQRQTLPHLSAAIQSIVVSPSGSSYGIRLSDNSAMILSTSELHPTFSISGPQLPAIRRRHQRLPFLPTVDMPSEDAQVKHSCQVPAAVSLIGASRLLLAVPAHSSPQASKHACYLQTIDAVSAQQVARQALTRTNVTTLNFGPESNQIAEPSVTHLGISSDGHWLATVDEWEPPEMDVAHVAFDDERTSAEQHSRMEVYLKLWSWDEISCSWELVSRIDNPHATPSGTPCKILALAADPSGTGFATLGEDNTVRAWRPTARKRHNLDVRAADGRILTTWKGSQVTELPVGASHAGKLGYSADGSVVFAAFESPSQSIIHLINSESGEVRSSPTNLFDGPLFGLGILDRYLIVVSDALRVWDLVSEELLFGFCIDTNGLDQEHQRSSSHLAINHRDNSFAVTIPDPRSKSRSRVAVFKPEKPTPLFTTSLPSLVMSLLPATGGMGYHCIDAAAEIRMIRPRPSLPTSDMAVPNDHTPIGNGIANIYGAVRASNEDGRPVISGLSSMRLRPADERDEGSRVVSQKQLADVFEAGSATVLPPVANLFEKVAALLAGR